MKAGDLCGFCADYGVIYDRFMSWQHHQLGNEKLGKTVGVEQLWVIKVRIIGKSCSNPTVKMGVKQPEVKPLSNVYMFMSRNHKVVRILHYKCDFYMFYEKCPVMEKFRKSVFDEFFIC